jgi:hypothetical protein
MPCRRLGPSGVLADGTQTCICSPLEREEVRLIKKKEGTGIKRVNINVEINLHNAFKAATAAQGVDMTTVLIEFIQDYVARNGLATPRKSRRA